MGCHPEGPRQAEQWGQVNLMRFNKGNCKVCTRVKATPITHRSWGMKGLSAALLKKTWGYRWMEAGHDPAVCPHSPDSQLYPGLHQKKSNQQVREVLLPLCSVL